MVQIAEEEYEYGFEFGTAPGLRERHGWDLENGRVVRFRVQLEIYDEDDNTWKPVVRWDNSHEDCVDCDLFNRRGGKRKKKFVGLSASEGLTIAQEDLSENWEEYWERYSKGWFPWPERRMKSAG